MGLMVNEWLARNAWVNDFPCLVHRDAPGHGIEDHEKYIFGRYGWARRANAELLLVGYRHESRRHSLRTLKLCNMATMPRIGMEYEWGVGEEMQFHIPIKNFQEIIAPLGVSSFRKTQVKCSLKWQHKLG